MARLSLAPLSWAEPDRRRLYRALLVLTSPTLTPFRAAVAAHALLSDLEIYDDPDQGAGSWLLPDEIAPLAALGMALKDLVGGEQTIDSVDQLDWREARDQAAFLLSVIEGNVPAIAWRDFFSTPGIDLAERDQPRVQERE